MIMAKQKQLIGRSDNEVVYDIYFSMKVVQKYQPIKRHTHLTYVASPFGPKGPLLKLAEALASLGPARACVLR